jgi:hypothetical protein
MADFGDPLSGQFNPRALDPSTLIPGAQAAKAAAGSASQGPWSGKKSSGSFFKSIKIDGKRWNKLYPYRLLVWDVGANGGKGAIAGTGGSSDSIKIFTESNAPGRYTISFQPIGNKWQFQLPITPQQYSVSTPYAINVSATLRGIAEEHSGTRFKMINCGGTMGVWPQRRNLNSPPGSPTNLETLFSGTLEAFGGLKRQVDKLVNVLNPKKALDLSPQGPELEGTGYYQALLLDQFLEQYAEAKRRPENAGWRLVFDIPKENQSFIVTPIQFAYSRAMDSPGETKYSFQLKAWRRIDINQPVAPSGFDSLELKQNDILSLISAIEESRRTLGAVVNLVRAVRSDAAAVFNLLRETALFFKDLAGVVITMADLPDQIKSDASSVFKDTVSKLDDFAFKKNDGGISAALKKTLSDIKKGLTSREGVSESFVSSGQLGQNAVEAQATDPTADIFQNPEQNFDLFNAVSTDQVNFNFAQQERIDTDLEDVRLTTVDDLIQARATLLELALQISDAFGSGSSDYNKIYSRSAPKDRVQEMSIDEFAVLRTLYDTIQALDSVTSTNELDQGRTQSAFEYVGSLANASEIEFNSNSQAKTRVPVPFGLNMEQIAARYLGNPDRWLEIATLNDMRSPYIDEDGFFLNLLSNADGRRFNIESNTNLFVGQKINLLSLTQPTVTRRIINIERIGSANYLITTDGLDNLDVYTTADNARMRAYLPGTVNSQDQFYIPSDLQVTDTVLSRPVPSTSGDPLVGLSKVDWLLTDSGDLATDAFGDFRLAAGMTNLIQALKMKFATPPGRLIKHPGFGAGLTPGISTADLNDSDVIRQIIVSIDNDPRYGQILSLNVQKDGPTYSVAVAVTLADGSGVFPISFVLNG